MRCTCVSPLFQCSFCLPGLGPGGGPWAPWGLIFDVSEATGVTFWMILASFWEPGAPCGHFPRFSGARVPQNRKLCKNMLPNGSHFGSLLSTLGTLGLHKGGPWSQNGAQSEPKVGFVAPGGTQGSRERTMAKKRPSAGGVKIWVLHGK